MNVKHLILVITVTLQSISVLAYSQNSEQKGEKGILQTDSSNSKLNNQTDFSLENRSLLWCSLQISVNVTPNKMMLFTYDDGSETGISRNGNGRGIVIGYIPGKHLDYSLGIYSYTPQLDTDPENASASFNRYYLNPVIKYTYETPDNKFMFNFGAGLLLSSKPTLDIDASEIPFGAHNQYIYNNGVGATLHFEFQNGTVAEPAIIRLFVKYTHISFQLKTAMLDGINWPMDLLTDEVKNEVGKMNSNGFEIGISFGFGFELPSRKSK